MAVKKIPKWIESKKLFIKKFKWASDRRCRRRYWSCFLRHLNVSERINRLICVQFVNQSCKLENNLCKEALLSAEKYADSAITLEELLLANRNLHAELAPTMVNTNLEFTDDYYFGARISEANIDNFFYSHLRNDKNLLGKILLSVVGPGWNFDPNWRNDTTIALARQMYDSKDFSPMPILADALQDADCNEIELLTDMRSPESYWCRGCRILDEILQKRLTS